MSHATARPPADTHEMRLVSKLMVCMRKDPLATFIAKRRHPGKEWTSWESIAYEIRDMLKEEYTREAVRRWAKRYGIPVDTTADDGEELAKAYRDTVSKAGIKAW
jgi:hypothetical protein